MSDQNVVSVSPRTLRVLSGMQAVIAALLALASAGAFADMVGADRAAQLLAVVAAIQAGLSAFLARAVGRAATAAVQAAGASPAAMSSPLTLRFISDADLESEVARRRTGG